MASSFTQNRHLELPANGDQVNGWNVPVNNDFTAIDACFGGVTTLNAVGLSGVQALTLAQYQSPIWVVTGALTANINYQLPPYATNASTSAGGRWSVYNNTTGAFTITISSVGGGSSVVLAQGYRTAILCDGTNVSVDNNAPVSAAGASNQIQYNGGGILAGSSNLTFNGSTLSLTGAASFSGSLSSGAFTANGASQVNGTLLATSTLTTNGTLVLNGGVISFGAGNGGGYIGFVSGGAVYEDSGTGDVTVRTYAGGSTYYYYGFGTNGNFVSPGDVVAFSDARLKADIAPLVGAREIVRALHGRRFTWKRDGAASIGFIAQEVREVVPEMVHETRPEDGEPILGVAYDKAAAILVEALKEMMDEVDQLKVEVARLKSRGGRRA